MHRAALSQQTSADTPSRLSLNVTTLKWDGSSEFGTGLSPMDSSSPSLSAELELTSGMPAVSIGPQGQACSDKGWYMALVWMGPVQTLFDLDANSIKIQLLKHVCFDSSSQLENQAPNILTNQAQLQLLKHVLIWWQKHNFKIFFFKFDLLH